jgi:predicted nucleic acid-binding protein
MTDYLLDTNHLNRLIDPGHPLRAQFSAGLGQGDTFSINLPIITETVAGFSILPRAVSNWAEWQMIRPSLALLPLDETDALDAAALQVVLRRRGRQLATVDALVATTALRYDLTLLTTDGDFTSVPTLRVVNWLP